MIIRIHQFYGHSPVTGGHKLDYLTARLQHNRDDMVLSFQLNRQSELVLSLLWRHPDMRLAEAPLFTVLRVIVGGASS